ncbi:SusC/RagA family TonB-linked outer membrane protein [Chitinophaga ginsengisoli]|uniref:TonB-linked SusC/RagA family outer membrane protein n=1 Tax=Chitinophaga ginsengisoli TaxID=363837 RepID=A0A2P8FNR8_9BACT|nr:TonB-dependent receptor [Chitinophaga ginsengisoli]PSL23305.1 TonB-linked SusC/RagA family outer membrane protein [Chitinophaga ginsengisoli]
MKRVFYLLPMLLFSMLTVAQQKLYQGTVTSRQGKTPLPGVTVQAGKSNAITDNTGHFSINAAPGEKLTFTYLGMKPMTQEVPANESVLSIELEENATDLNQIVVTGYQTQKKADLTGAVAVVNVAEIKDIPLGNPLKALQGRVPGVMITTDGSPNSAATVRIRGIGTLGNNDPLYVIDGIPTKRGLQELNQNDIESIQVLKDASSATIYGSRAANGVIIVTTKKAKKGFSKINVDASSSLQHYSTKLKTLNTAGRGRAYWQAAVNDHADPNNNQIYQYEWNGDYNNPVLNKIVLPEYIDAAKTMKPADTYWYDEIAQTSLLQSYNISLTNGGEKGNSFFSVGMYNNKGIVKDTRQQKLTARFNTDYSFFKGRLKIGENLSATYIKDALVPATDILFAALVQQPVVPVHSVSGGWGGPAPGMTDRQNPVRLIEDNKQNKSQFVRLFGNAYADVEIIPRLHFRSNLGIDYNGTFQRVLRKSYTSGFLSDKTNQVNTSQDYNGNWVWQNTLSYNVALKKHRVDVLLGEEQIKYMAQNFFASRQGYALENIDYAYLDAGTTQKDNGGSGSGYTLLSYFGKVNYAYDNKYLASVTLRRDGSSRFGKENRFGTFPAFSLGWRVSEEGAVKSALPFISDLKLRAGWGRSGNQEIVNNATYTLYSAIYGIDPTWDFDSGSAYDLNGSGTGQLPSGYTLIRQGNTALKWESTKEMNLGVDFGVLDNHISGSVDYFIKKTSDILINPAYLAVIGEGGSRYANGASMENKGLEAFVTYSGDIAPGLTLTMTGNVATYRNRITYLPDEVLTSYPGNGQDKTILGRSINSTFGYVADGIFQSQQEVDDHANQIGKGVGRIRYKDLNGDKQINDKDRDYIGKGDPDFTYGLNVALEYKHFDLSFFLQGVQGIQVYNTYKTYTDFASLWTGTNWGQRTLDAWTPQHTNTSIPALTLVDRNNENRTSTYFLEPGSYLKLRNIQLGYSFRHLFSGQFQTARVYLQGSNLFTVKSKSFTATDPENPNNAYPIPVIGTVGLNLSF